MAGKITDLTALTGASVATSDLIEILDVSDTTLAATGTNKKITIANLLTGLGALPLAGGTMTGTIFGTTIYSGEFFSSNDPNTGTTGPGTIRIAGSSFLTRMGESHSLGWCAGSPYSAGTDVGFVRNAAGVVEVNNGTAGTFRDMKLRSLIMTSGSGSVIILPTADPGVSGALWNNGGTIAISA